MMASRSVVLPLWKGPTSASHRGADLLVPGGLLTSCPIAASLSGARPVIGSAGGCSACPVILASEKIFDAVHCEGGSQTHGSGHTAFANSGNKTVVARLRPGHQYAAASRLNTTVSQIPRVARSEPGVDSGVCFMKAGLETTHTRPRSRGTFCPSFACRCPSKIREQGMPDARCTRGPVCKLGKRKQHTSIQGSGEHPTFPAQWLDGL